MSIFKLSKVKIMRNFIFCVLAVAIFCIMSGFSNQTTVTKVSNVNTAAPVMTTNINEEQESNTLDYFISLTDMPDKFTDVMWNRPFGVAFNKGIMYLVTAPPSGNGMLSKVTPDGKVHEFAKLEGNFCGDPSKDKSFISLGIDFDKNGNVYITLGDKLIKISAEGKVKTIASGFSRCVDVKLDNKGNIYVADEKTDTIYKFTPSMKKSIFYKGKKANEGISSLAFDKKYENLYAGEGNKILKFKIGPKGSQMSQVFASDNIGIVDICIDNNNNIYASSFTLNTIIKIDKKGKATNLTDSDALSLPIGISIGKAGFDPNILYVSEAFGIVKVPLRE